MLTGFFLRRSSKTPLPCLQILFRFISSIAEKAGQRVHPGTKKMSLTGTGAIRK
jgi:hypothetical protein